MNKVLLNYKQIISKIDSLEKKNKVKTELIAVSKTFEPDRIEPLIIEGHRTFGENKVQEAISKWIPLKKKYTGIKLHLIGPLQTNKIKQALEVFDVFETIDREKLVKKICANLGLFEKHYQFFVQVNTGNEPQKSGLKLDEVQNFVGWAINDMKLNVTGLMCIPPIDDEPSDHFKLLKNKKEECGLKYISMGMSKDYESAIKYGSTHVRVGSAIFGKRS